MLSFDVIPWPYPLALFFGLLLGLECVEPSATPDAQLPHPPSYTGT